jgi:parvulin-like peptidyl-prolyl isomerase
VVSAPIKTRWGFYVLRLLDKSEQRQRPYSEVHDEIQRTLSGRRMYLEDRRIVAELRKKADVVEKLTF